MIPTREELLMSAKGNVLAQYLGSGDPALKNYYSAWVNNMADDATVEGSMLDGAVQGGEAVRSVVLTIRSLYDRQEHKFAGPYGDNGFLEDYVAKVNGEPIGCVVLITRNAAGQTQHVVASYRPLSSLLLFSRLLRKKFAGTPIAELGQQGVQFATFPETVVPYYPYFSFLQPAYQIVGGREHMKLLDQAVTVPSAATHAIGDACRQAQVVVSIGVNERDGDTMYNTQLLFDADGRLIQRRRKISPTYHERMVWGQGDGSGLRAVDSAAGRIGQLACWEHYNPLARYAMMADGEQIHSAMYPGSIFGDLFSEQTQVNIRQHALESACFVVCATAWLDPDQQARIVKDTGGAIGAISSGCFTAIVAPDSTLLCEPIRSVQSI